METGNKICPHCSAQVDHKAVMCDQCGYDFDTGLEATRHRGSVSPKVNRFGCLKLVGTAIMVTGLIGVIAHYLELSIALW